VKGEPAMLPNHKDQLGAVDELTLYTLVDNSAGYSTSFLAQHGLSILVDARAEGCHMAVLFDAGQAAEPLLHNMSLLGLSPSATDMVVLSHCHYDHTGGLAGVLREVGRSVPVVAHSSIFRDTYSLKPYLRRVGMGENGREEVTATGGRFALTDAPLRLMPGLTTTGEVPRLNDFEGGGIGSYNLQDGQLVPDILLDDLSLVAHVTGKGLVVLSGCGHAGIVNILHHARTITGVDRIHAVVGGFHLVDAPDDQVEKTVAALREVTPDHVISGHCTGRQGLAALAAGLGDRFSELYAGKVIKL